MNLEQLKKNVEWRVQFEPPAIRLVALGCESPGRNEDWIIQDVLDTEIHPDKATMLPLTTSIGKDSVYPFSHNRSRSVPGARNSGRR